MSPPQNANLTSKSSSMGRQLFKNLLFFILVLCANSYLQEYSQIFTMDDSWNQKFGNSARSRHSHYFTNHAEWSTKYENPLDGGDIEIESLLMDPNRGEMIMLGSMKSTHQQHLIYVGVENGTFALSDSFIDSTEWIQPNVGYLNAVVDADFGNYYIVRRSLKRMGEFGVLKMNRKTVQVIFRISSIVNDLMTVSENLLLIALAAKTT